MSSKKKNISLGIAISAALVGTAMSPENMPWIAVAEAAQTSTQTDNHEQQLGDAFFNSQYTYNDAELLAAFWGEKSVWDAKLKIGGHVLGNNQSAIDQALNHAHTALPSSLEDQQSEAFFNSKYNYADAELLAAFWGENSVWDAKLKIGDLLLNNQIDDMQQALTNAMAQ